MTARRKATAESEQLLREKAREIDSHAVGAALTPGPKRNHLEGWRYYIVYVPAMFVAGWIVLLFVSAVERMVYGDSWDIGTAS